MTEFYDQDEPFVFETWAGDFNGVDGLGNIEVKCFDPTKRRGERYMLITPNEFLIAQLQKGNTICIKWVVDGCPKTYRYGIQVSEIPEIGLAQLDGTSLILETTTDTMEPSCPELPPLQM